MKTIFYDLSELFLSSGIKFKYYGIARTVMEVAFELTKLDNNIRFVVYSPLHRRFFEVTPRIGEASPTNVLDHNLPASATPLRLRQNFNTGNLITKTFYAVIRKLVDHTNMRRWSTIPADAVKEVDLNCQILVSLGRPKIMSDYLMALSEANIQPIFVPMLYDMIPLHDFTHRNGHSFPQNFIYDNKVVINAASLILAISQFTKDEIVHFSNQGTLPAIPNVIAVPLCHELRDTNEKIEKIGPDSTYILTVGAYNGRKNLECVINALLELHVRGEKVPYLVMAGARRKRVEKFLQNKKYNAITNKFIFIHDPNQAELKQLYTKAHAVVLASRMEGWGLPVSEALWCGTPALAADVPAIREAGSNLALYFDPEDPSALAEHLNKLIQDKVYYAELKYRIAHEMPKMRRWKNVAEDTLNSIRSLYPSDIA